MEQFVTLETDASPERVWEVMTDVERWPEWAETVTSVTRLDEGPLRLDSRVRIEQPRLPAAEYVVVELSPGRSFTWVATTPGVRTTARHAVEALPNGGAKVRLGVEQAGPLGLFIGRLFFKGLTDRYLATEAAGLKARCEGKVGERERRNDTGRWQSGDMDCECTFGCARTPVRTGRPGVGPKDSL